MRFTSYQKEMGSISDSQLGGPRLRSSERDLLFWLKFFRAFLQLLEEDAGIIPQVGSGCFLSHTLQLFINQPTA